MKLNLKQINWKQPKYIFPVIIFIPVLYLTYTFCHSCTGSEHEEQTATDRINMELPEARTDDVGDKLSSMTSRYNNDNAFTVIDGIGTEIEQKESLDEGEDYTIDLEQMMREAQLAEQEQMLVDLQRQIEQNNRQVQQAYSPYEDDGYNAYMQELERIRRNSAARQQEIEQKPDPDEIARLEAEQNAREEEEEREKNRPLLVSKSSDSHKDSFNTVSGDFSVGESTLIRAMIDKTTKAHEGTRLRFKLLDNVTVGNVKLLKGTYLYGTVSGFSQQRVMANINSILVGDQFLKVDLSVFDNDGMEGFYVPASAFREFMKQAGTNVLGQNMQFSSYGGYGSSLNGESLALQALQNIYSAGTSAISANIRKNKAKIKYNTIVYLINSREAR